MLHTFSWILTTLYESGKDWTWACPLLIIQRNASERSAFSGSFACNKDSKIFFLQVKESLGQFPPADLYVIEEQSHRNPSNRGFLNISVQLRVLEAMVLAVSKLTSLSPVHSLSPNRVSRYFGTNGKSGAAAKKKMSIEFATKMIETLNPMKTPLGNTIKVPQDLVKYFEKEKKKDDLSDCLLQAAAVVDWCKMTQKLNYN